jgi:hypothetical protein
VTTSNENHCHQSDFLADHLGDGARTATDLATACAADEKAMRRLLRAQTVDGTLPPMMYLSDLNMLVNLGGRERTRADFENLCGRTGFALTDVIPLPQPAAFSLIEATPS